MILIIFYILLFLQKKEWFSAQLFDMRVQTITEWS